MLVENLKDFYSCTNGALEFALCDLHLPVAESYEASVFSFVFFV